jgi:hypothetical protein
LGGTKKCYGARVPSALSACEGVAAARRRVSTCRKEHTAAVDVPKRGGTAQGEVVAHVNVRACGEQALHRGQVAYHARGHEGIHFPLQMNSLLLQMDLLLVAEPVDFPWLRYTLATTLTYTRPHTVYLLTYAVDEATRMFPECVVGSLSRFPFSVEGALPPGTPWFQYMAQLARLYAPQVFVLDRPYLCLDANACVLSALPWMDTQGHPVVGTRHGVYYPYVLHMERLHRILRRGLLQSADVPYAVFEPGRVLSMLHDISHDRKDEPFWRLYLTAIHKYHLERGASEKEVYANWWATRSVPTTVTVRTAVLEGEHAVTPLLSDAKGYHLATYRPQTLTRAFSVPWWKQYFLTPPPPKEAPVDLLVRAVPAPAIVADWGATVPLTAVPPGWSYALVALEHVPKEPVVLLRGIAGRLSLAHLQYVLALFRGRTVVVLEEHPLPVALRINTDVRSGSAPRALWWSEAPLSAYKSATYVSEGGVGVTVVSL